MSAPYLGDFPADQAVNFTWDTNDGNGGSITRAADGAISVYKDNSDGTSFDQTQVTTGVTNDEDMDGLTGVHSCCIVTTNAWYEIGHDYSVILSASTIDGQTVNATIAQFSIENRAPVAKIGTPVSLDSGGATIAGMLTKMADDNGGADFDAGSDSLEKIQTSVAAGFPLNINADVEPGGGIITTGTNTANDSDSTWANDGAYWQVAATTAVGGFGLNMYQVFTLGLTRKPSILRINAKESLAGKVHVWLYDYNAVAFEQVSDDDTAISGNADDDYSYIINSRHQQASDGEVQVRYTSTSEETNKYLYLDFVVIQAVAISELTATEISQAVWETNLAAVHGAFPESAGHILHDTFAIVTTVSSGSTTTSFTLTAGQATNDVYNGMLIIIEDATDDHYETRRIVDYTSGRVVTVDRAFGFTPASGDHVEIVNIAYADVNVTHLAASAIQQSGGYTKISSGTGTGQISVTSGIVASNLSQILATALTETSGLLAGGFKKFFNKATPTGTINSIPDAVPGAAGGMFIAGSNAATTLATLTVSGATTLTGAVSLGSTLGVAGATTFTGAVALSSTLAVAGTTTLTGAVSAPAGITANITGNITGNLSGSVGTVSGAVGSVAGAVGSVGSGGIASTTFASGAITAAAIATNALGALELAADAVAEIADAVWDEVQSGHTTAGTFGLYLDTEVSGVGGGSAASIADAVWDEARSGHVAAGSFGEGVGLKDDAITSAKYDESTAFPIESADSSTTQITRVSSQPGLTIETYNVDDGTDPISGALVMMTSDAAGSVVLCSGYTDSSGDVTLVHDKAAGTTVYLWTFKLGYTNVNPDTETTS